MTIGHNPRPRQARWWRLSLVWLVLLAASHALRWREPVPAPLAGERRLEVPVPGTAGSRERQARIAFTSGCPADAGGTPILLIHGSPGSRGDFGALVDGLARDRCVVAPDLPGFGRSTRGVPDYSFVAHAAYLDALLDRLGYDRVHLVGFSMGGGVALTLAGGAPGRVASVTLLSAIGVQELELFGRYHVNHAVHGLQLAALWLLAEAVPHMGALDRAFIGVEYARNFYDSDQRPLRGILASLEMPVLILHGRSDALVPFEAAVEHHRLVPHSRLEPFDGGHLELTRRPGVIAGPLSDFLANVDADAAPRRGDAPPGRVAAAARPYAGAAGAPRSGLRLALEALGAGALVGAAAAGLYRRRRRRRARGLAPGPPAVYS